MTGTPAPESAPGFATGFAGTLVPGRRPAVVCIDMMRAYFDPASTMCLPSRGCLDAAARVVEAARAVGVPVIHTRVAFGPDAFDGGLFVRKVPALRQLVGDSPMGRLMDEVAPAPDEPVVVKQYASAFFGTSLQPMLSAAGIDTVVLVGVSTSGCIRATGVDAVQHGFVPLVVRDAVGDRDSGPHDAALYDLQAKYAEVVDEKTAVAYLEESRR